MQMIETKFVEYCKTLALSNKARSQNLVIVIRKATQTHKIGGGGGTSTKQENYSTGSQVQCSHSMSKWALGVNIQHLSEV